MRIVLDTGILIAALITTATPPALIYQAWRKKRFELITSEWQFDEFRRVSHYPKLHQYFTPAEAGNMINGLRHQATILEALPTVDVSPDPDDNPILSMAQVSQAHYLVTGDKRDLLALRTFSGVPIITARRFVEILDI